MKARITVGIIILATVFGIGTVIKKTEGHCFWDVFVVPWTSTKKSTKTIAALDVRYNTCALPGYYTGWGKVSVTVNGDTHIDGGTIWADLTREPGEHESHGTTGKYKIRCWHSPWAETSARTNPTEKTLLSITPRQKHRPTLIGILHR